MIEFVWKPIDTAPLDGTLVLLRADIDGVPVIMSGEYRLIQKKHSMTFRTARDRTKVVYYPEEDAYRWYCPVRKYVMSFKFDAWCELPKDVSCD